MPRLPFVVAAMPAVMELESLLSSWVLGKKTAATGQEEAMEDCTDQSLAQRSTIPTGFFRVPGLFVRLSSKGLNAVDPDSVWSPTSPLDFKNLPSNIGSTNLKLRTGTPRVGLGLVDALTADESSSYLGGKDSFLESIRPFLELGLPKVSGDATCQKAAPAGVTMNGITDFAQSEEYTCVIERGPNPKTTHILGGETLAVPRGVQDVSKRPVFTIEPIVEQPWPLSPAGVASGLCSYCRKRLQKNRDVYMYLGEKAFCSNECRKCCIDEEIEEVELMMLDSGSSSALYLGEGR